MGETSVYLIRYFVNGLLHKAVILAERYTEAESILINNYKDYGIDIEIEECEFFEEGDTGVILTWNQPIKD
jgi:hypothetical protein